MDNKKKIEITCSGTDYIDINELENIQGNLKELTIQNFKKLKKSILKYGFRFPCYIWNKTIISGNHRIKVVRELINDGYTIDKIPCVKIKAKDVKEAKKLILLENSHYAKITDEGLYEFISDMDLDFNDLKNTLDFPDIDIKVFYDGYFSDKKPPEDDLAGYKKGDIWKIGQHRLLCGEYLLNKEFDKLMNLKNGCNTFIGSPYYCKLIIQHYKRWCKKNKKKIEFRKLKK